MIKKNYWVRSGAYTMMQRIAAFLFGFGSYFFLVRYLSVNEFGVWSLYIVVSTSVEMARSAFIQNAFVKFFNESSTDKNSLFISSLILNFFSTLLFVIILLGATPFLQSIWESEVIGDMIYLYCITSVILIPFTQLNYLEQANHHFSGVFWSAVVRQGSFFALVVCAYFFLPDLSIVFFAASHCVCAFLGLTIAYFKTKEFLPERRNFDWGVVRKLFEFGKYILGTGITSTVGKNAAHAILGAMSHNMVAKYDACVRIINFIEIPTLSISNIVYPKIAERAGKNESNDGVKTLYEKSVGVILGFILPVIVGVALFPKFFLTITAGTKYIESAEALRIMAIASLVIPFIIQLGSAFEVINRPHVSFYLNLGSSLLNLTLNLIFTPAFGFIGAAYAFALSLLITFIAGQWYLNRFLKVKVYGVLFNVVSFYKDSFHTGRSMVLKIVRRN